MFTKERNDFIQAINEYFGYEIQSARQFKREFKDDYLEHAQSENLLNFLMWYERKLNK